MSQSTRGGKVTAVKDEENKSSGIGPYVIGALAGVGLGLLGSLLIDKVVENVQAQQEQAHPSCGPSKCNRCAVCFDEASSTYRTQCCNQLLHINCYEEYRRNGITKCPYCRSRSM